jgi:N-acetylmuramoyl-L-alanine amidase
MPCYYLQACISVPTQNSHKISTWGDSNQCRRLAHQTVRRYTRHAAWLAETGSDTSSYELNIRTGRALRARTWVRQLVLLIHLDSASQRSRRQFGQEVRLIAYRLSQNHAAPPSVDQTAFHLPAVMPSNPQVATSPAQIVRNITLPGAPSFQHT